MSKIENTVDQPIAKNDDAIFLEEPIRRGEQEIKSVTLRKPKAGELRGISLTSLGELDVSALQKVLPRITQPSLTEAEVAGLELADITAMGMAVASFLLKKATRESLGM